MGKKVFGLLLPLLLMAVFAFMAVKEGLFAPDLADRDGESTSGRQEAMAESAPIATDALLLLPTPHLTVGTADRVDSALPPDTAEAISQEKPEEGKSVTVMAPVGDGGLVTEFRDAYVVVPETEVKPTTLVTGFADTLPLSLPLASPNVAEEEMQAVYVATAYRLDFPSSTGLSASELKGELDAILEECQALGYNTVFFQVRPASDAFYTSSIFPASRYLTVGEGGKAAMDPLGYLISQAHKKGIAVHAWINPFRVGGVDGLAKDNPAALHPEWLLSVDGGLYYDPALPSVRGLVVDGVCELVARYDIDGILFDDYFYPVGITNEDAFSYAAYLASGGSLSLGDFRRENVNQLIRAVYTAINALSDHCRFGVAPRGVWRNLSSHPDGSATSGGSAYDEIYCDAIAWVKGGYIDYLAPQLYWPFDSAVCPFAVLADWWDQALSHSGVELTVSLAAYAMSEGELARQIAYLDGLATYGGYAVYRYGSLQE